MTLSVVPIDGPPGPDVSLVASAVLDRSPKGIAAAVHRLIRAGRLAQGDRLPTVRDLAKVLGVSPATVSEAWQALAAVGAIQARGRAGTFVRDTVIDLSPCDGPTLMVDDLTAPLERVPFTCANDARVFTLDLYSGQSELTTGSTSFDE